MEEEEEEAIMCHNNGDMQPVIWRHHCAVFIRNGWLALSVELCCRKKLNVRQ